MNQFQELSKIWAKDSMKFSDNTITNVLKRGFVNANNLYQKDILITGINPSFRQNDCLNSFLFNFQDELMKDQWDTYWSPIKKFLYDKSNHTGFDYRKDAAYIDIFSFREKDQNFLKSKLLKTEGGIDFLVKQLKFSQSVIENIIKPKVIIIKNKESSAYWGKYAKEGLIWMGYDFEKIGDCNAGEICRINKFLNSPYRINNELVESNITNSIVLFSHHINQYTKRERRPTIETISRLLELYK